MKTITGLIAVIALVVAALAAGYWWGSDKSATSADRPAKVRPRSHTKPKILYYRNPMGHPDISPVPKKDSMGMDYLPVYEGKTPSDNSAVKISTEKIQKLGVKTEIVALRKLTRTVRAVATVQADERGYVHGGAQVRGLDPAALRKYHWPIREKRRAADGCVQS